MATVLHSPRAAKNYDVYSPITTQERFEVTTLKYSARNTVTEATVIVDGHAITIDRKVDLRYQSLNRYRIASGAVSILWLLAAFAALASRSSAEPFFALFFSTFGLYLVFAIKCREDR